jgi:hypothetical protein
MNLNIADVDTYYISRVTKTLTADAWGQIITPFATYDSVLRIHEYLIKTDSVIIKLAMNIVTQLEIIRDTMNNYMYMKNGVGYPAAIVHTGAGLQVRDVEWYAGWMVADRPEEDNMQAVIYPNPAHGTIGWSWPSARGEVQATLFSMEGRELLLESCNCSAHKFKLDLPAGLYLLRLQNRDAAVTRKIVIE